MPGEQGRAVRAHQPGNVRAVDFVPEQVFHDPEQGVIEKGSALHQNPLAKFGRIPQAKHLVQGVARHGIAQAGGDIPDIGPFLLRLLDLGVHEHRAARSEIRRTFGEEGQSHEAIHVQPETSGKGFKKGPAARRAGFIQRHAGDDAVVGLEAFHVLPADINDVGAVRHEGAGRFQVRHGFHVHKIKPQRGFGQLRAVARGRRSVQDKAGGQGVEHFDKAGHKAAERIALVAPVPGGEQGAFLINERGFHRGGAEIDAEVRLARGRPRIAARRALPLMALPEGEIVRLIGKKTRQGRGRGRRFACRLIHAGGEFVQRQDGKGFFPFPAGAGVVRRAQGRAQSNHVLRVGQIDNFFGAQTQGGDELPPQFVQKVQRPAQKGHIAANGVPARETADGLLHHGLKDGGRQIGAGRALVEQGNNIRFGEHAAA